MARLGIISLFLSTWICKITQFIMSGCICSSLYPRRERKNHLGRYNYQTMAPRAPAFLHILLFDLKKLSLYSLQLAFVSFTEFTNGVRCFLPIEGDNGGYVKSKVFSGIDQVG